MLSYQQNLNLSPKLFENFAVKPEEVLFFDIETTGLSADTSFLYLICVGFLSEGKPVLRQWFSEGFTDEVNLLHAFFSCLKDFRVLVHYNGSTFDIPYIQKKCIQHKLSYRLLPTSCLNDASSADACILDASIADASIEDTCVEDACVENASIEDACIKDASIEDSCIKDASIEDVYVKDACIKDVCVPASYNEYIVVSVDLYRMLKPHKHLFSLSSCRQKDVERLLCIDRKDQYDGGQLIEIYKQYLGRARYDHMKHELPLHVPEESGLATLPVSPSESLLYLLLLHNAEDVEGLIRIAALLPLLQVFNGCVPSYEGICSTEQELLAQLHFPERPESLPSSIEFSFGFVTFSKDRLTLHIPYYSGELKYFFDNYKDYYYLPLEDCAIHKSVAEGVDKSRRKAATATTCYIKKSGFFLPQKDSRFTPAFREDKKSAISWFESCLLCSLITPSEDKATRSDSAHSVEIHSHMLNAKANQRITNYINSLFL